MKQSEEEVAQKWKEMVEQHWWEKATEEAGKEREKEKSKAKI